MWELELKLELKLNFDWEWKVLFMIEKRREREVGKDDLGGRRMRYLLVCLFD